MLSEFMLLWEETETELQRVKIRIQSVFTSSSCDQQEVLTNDKPQDSSSEICPHSAQTVGLVHARSFDE